MSAPELSTIENLGELISVQTSATVSRTVQTVEGGRVVLFAFDEGEELTEHTAAMPVFLMTLEGRLRITADGQDVELVPGGLLHMGTRLPHAVLALEPSKLALIMLDSAK